jgi:hypothetical protein
MPGMGDVGDFLLGCFICLAFVVTKRRIIAASAVSGLVIGVLFFFHFNPVPIAFCLRGLQQAIFLTVHSTFSSSYPATIRDIAIAGYVIWRRLRAGGLREVRKYLQSGKDAAVAITAAFVLATLYHLLVTIPLQLRPPEFHRTPTVFVPPNAPPTPPRPPVDIEKVGALRITSAQVITPVSNKSYDFVVMAKNVGKWSINGPVYSIATIPWYGVMTTQEEQKFFDVLNNWGLPSAVLFPDREIYSGQEIGFNTNSQPPDKTGPPITAQDLRELIDGKKHLYLMVILQYGKTHKKPFPDGLYRPHSLFCIYFDKLYDKNMQLCHGFNYVWPKE